MQTVEPEFAFTIYQHEILIIGLKYLALKLLLC